MFDWQENLLKYNLLAVGTCSNGDVIAVRTDLPKETATYYISSGDMGMYEGNSPLSIQVAADFHSFLKQCDEDDNFPDDYYAAKN